MSRELIITALVLFVFCSPASAGYRDLQNKIDVYQPPAYLLSRPDRTETQPAANDDLEFTAALERIKAMKSSWIKTVKPSVATKVFFRPKKGRRITKHSDAASVLKNTFSLIDLQSLVLFNNPGIRASEHRFRASVESFSQVSNLDEILRRYTAITEGLMTGIGPMKGTDPVGMKFPFPGVLALKSQVVDQEVKATRESLEITRREAISAAGKTFWELLYTRRAREITNQMIQILGHLESVAVTRYEAGKTSFQDVIKIRINRETLEENLISLQRMQGNVETKIRELVNLPDGAHVGEPKGNDPAIVNMSEEALSDLAIVRLQELRRLRFRIGKMERMIEMAEIMILPGYSLNLSLYADEAVNQVGSSARKDTFMNVTTASVGAGLPKSPWYGTQDAYLFETREKLAALREDLKNDELKTTTAVRQAWFELDRSMREWRLYENSVVKLSQAALDVSTSGYEAGNVSFADVIGSYTLWLNSNLASERRRSDVGIAVAELHRRVGASLLPVTGSAKKTVDEATNE